MPLGEPSGRHLLWRLPTVRLAGRTLWRCHRSHSPDGTKRPMWWFATSPPGPTGGRFDLPSPNGSCYAATSLAAAVVEAFQEQWGTGSVIPTSALAGRVVASAAVPNGTVAAADLSHRRALAVGITGGLWSDRDRSLTKRWATELHGAGHQAIHHGVQHDPGGRLRAVTLFDIAGAHRPWGLQWPEPASTPCLDDKVTAVLATRGARLARHRPTLPVIEADTFDRPT